LIEVEASFKCLFPMGQGVNFNNLSIGILKTDQKSN
jgi:hypothetical protein